MSKLSIEQFGGLAPKILDPALLPPNKSQVAQNCRFDKGGITPLTKDTFVYKPTIPAGPILSIYPYKYKGTTYFFAFVNDVDVALGPIANDQYNRAYYTEGGVLKVTDNALFNAGGTAYPMSYKLPSPPAPTNAMTVTATPSGTDPTLQESRFYVYTYVNSYGSESPPSPISNEIVVWDGNEVDCAGMDTGPSDPLYDITKKRIYRVNQGAGASAYYQFVAEIDVADATFADSVYDASLGEPLPSAEWDGAPAGMTGLIALPNATLAGFVGNLVCFSVPQYPHAWPAGWQKPIEWPIVGLGSFGITLAVLTEGQPYAMIFTDPANAVPEQVHMGMSCRSKRGIVLTGNVVVYPAPAGLGALSQNGPDLITKDVIDKDKWLELYHPATINAYYWQAKYVGFYTKPDMTKAGFMFDLKTQDLVDLDFSATAGYHDPSTGNLYLQIGDDIVSFNRDTGFRKQKYTGKRLEFLPAVFGVVKVMAKKYPVTVDITYPDIPQTDSVPIPSRDAVRLVDVGLVEQVEVSLDNTETEVSAIFLATTPEELPL